MKFASISFAFAAALLTACSVDPSQTDDGANVEATDDAIASADFGYYVVTRRDMRKCVSPLCGGYFVKRLNQETTLCANGTVAAECYVADIQLTGLGLNAREESEALDAVTTGKALVRARYYRFEAFGSTFAHFKVNEAWKAATGSVAEGTFYRAADNGLRCIKAPCPSTSVTQLNSHDSYNVSKVDLQSTQVKADQAALNQAFFELTTTTGLLINGNVLLPKCMPTALNCGPKAIAEEFYLPIKHQEGVMCGTRGGAICSGSYYCKWEAGDICGAADAPGACALRPEVCPMIYKPVCACDGKTYSNACVAAAAGASVSSEGACTP